MGKSPYKKVAQGEMKGWIREEVLDLLPHDFFNDPVASAKGMGGKVIAESQWRWAGLFPLSEKRSVFLKRDLSKGKGEWFKYLIFPSKGRKEWFIAYQMGKRNLNIPKPLGWMERIHRGLVRESYYLSEAIESGISLAESASILQDEKVLTELVKTIVKMHSSGLLHQDLHAGNFLWDGQSFYLIDLHRARLLRSLSLNQRLWNLSHLFHSLRPIWEEKDHLRFLEQYFEGDSISSQKRKEYLMKIYSFMEGLQKRQWRSRTRRCLKESTEFSVQKEKGWTIYRRKEFSLDRLKRAVEKHCTIVQHTPSSLVKQSPEVMVSIVDDETGRICVKQFIHSSWWDRFRRCFSRSKGYKAWLGGNGLRVRGVSSIAPFALLERDRKEGGWDSFLVMEAPMAGEEMDRFLCKGFPGSQGKRRFIEAFARWLTSLHQKGIYHLDMKACNILVSKKGEGWDFKLLDLEDVRFNERIDQKKLFKNLLQLNTSVPKYVTRTDRLRFLRAYLQQLPIIRNEEAFLSKLMQGSQERGTVYVSPSGVVKEKAC